MVIMEEIYEAFDSAEKINIYNEGTVITFGSGDKNYVKILGAWNELLKKSHQMPAFGVSLNDLTVAEMKKGLWVEFEFGKQTECGGMPFEKLLAEVKKDNYGFNIIRYTAEYGYDGRCVYIDLEGNNMGNFYDVLLNI